MSKEKLMDWTGLLVIITFCLYCFYMGMTQSCPSREIELGLRRGLSDTPKSTVASNTSLTSGAKKGDSK